MSVSKTQSATLTGIYALARKSGLLQTRPGQWIFSRAYFLYKRHLEDSYRALARRHPELFEGGHILDIGANIGYTSLVFAHAVNPAYQVYSFEPEEFNFRLLQRLAHSRQSQGRIVPIQTAAGDRNGSIQLWRNPSHHADHRVLTSHLRERKTLDDSVQVPVVTIDGFVQRQGPSFPVRFIKIDVQGYELPVCQGMQRTLENNPKAVLALEYAPEEMRDLGFDPQELLNWLAAKNYQSYSLEKDGSLLPANADRMTTQPYTDLLFLHP